MASPISDLPNVQGFAELKLAYNRNPYVDTEASFLFSNPLECKLDIEFGLISGKTFSFEVTGKDATTITKI